MQPTHTSFPCRRQAIRHDERGPQSGQKRKEDRILEGIVIPKDPRNGHERFTRMRDFLCAFSTHFSTRPAISVRKYCPSNVMFLPAS